MSDYGNLKPDNDLTEIFTKVVTDVSPDDYGSVKVGSNTALLLTLRLLQRKDPDAVQYHLSRQGYDDMQELQEAVRSRQQGDFVLDVDAPVQVNVNVDEGPLPSPEEVREILDDSGFRTEMLEPPEDDEDGGD